MASRARLDCAGLAGALPTRTKEAIKTALAFTLGYGLALKTGWMNPTWVGLTVVVIALPTAGQSLQKGILRLAGTIPGCVAALIVGGIAPQSRWLALALICAWMFFTTYKMLSQPAKAYLWNVAGFTALIIATGGFESPAELFERAESRTVATVTGIVIYTLVTTFLWPQSNAGAIRKALGELLQTQRERLEALRRRASDDEATSQLRDLHLREVQQLAALDQALQAEGSESYEVREVRPELERLRDLSSAIMDCLDRVETSASTGGALRACLPAVDELLDEIDARLVSMVERLSNGSDLRSTIEVSLSLDREALGQLVPLDRAAVVVARGQLARLEEVTEEAIAQMQELAAPRAIRKPRARRAPTRSTSSPGYDLDYLRGASLVAATVAAGFLIWVFVNPPGHVGWIVLPGVVAMMVAGTQQLTATVFIRPTAIALALGIAVYVFLLPKLSTFLELGLVLFAAMFVVNYLFKAIGQFAGMIGVLLGISVQHQQAYSFAAAANNYIYVLGSFMLVYGMSYIIQSPRPEKAVLYLVRRFFRSASFLIASTSSESAWNKGLLRRWKLAWHHQELQRLPSKIAAWSKAISPKAFPSNAPDRIEDMVTALQAISYRVDELLDSRAAVPAQSLASELADDIRGWRLRLQAAFAAWAQSPESRADDELRERLPAWRAELERRIEDATTDKRAARIDDAEWGRFYRLLGGYRGVSSALLLYGRSAQKIDWAAWREERFS